MFQLVFGVDQLLPVDLIVAHHQQNTIADLGDLRSINDHAHRSRIYNHVIVLLCQSIQQVLKPLRAQQRDGIQQFVAHRDKVHARNVGVEQDFLLFGNAGQIVRQALLFGTRRKLHPINSGDHAPPQVRIHQDHPLASLCQLPAQRNAGKALALGCVGTGKHDLFDIPTQKGDIGGKGVEGLIDRVAQLGKFSKFKSVHSVFPPGSFRPICLSALWCFGSSLFSSGITAIVTRPVYFLMSSVVL